MKYYHWQAVQKIVGEKRMNAILKPFPLGAVEVTDSYCVNALNKEVEYLLSLQEGKLLAGFYENAGLKTPYLRYGGWENMLIGGHTVGHYLSAASQAYVNAGVSAENKRMLYDKITHIVDGFLECQENSKGERGFLWGAVRAKMQGVEAQFDNVEQGKTNILHEAWVPWYTMHKLLAGLIDCYRFAEYAPALKVATELGDWVYRRVIRWDKRLQKKVLSMEYGGMNDCMYALYDVTKEEKYALAAHRFDEEDLFERILSEEKNVLKDRHANTTIPKILGALNRYLSLHGRHLEGNTVDATRYLNVAKIFFETVVERHTYVTGGNSEWEHFGEDYVLDRERTNCNCETCNVYNMLKLARGLFCVTGDKKYTDYYDNAFVNTVLSSQNPQTGMTTYFQPMAGGFFKCYSSRFEHFWCCTGSGMENFSKLGDSAYYTDGKNIFVEQYLSSRLKTEQIELESICDFPLSDTACFYVRRIKKQADLYFRVPDWLAGQVLLTKNGTVVQVKEEKGHLCVPVSAGDKICLNIPVSITLHGLPDSKDTYAFKFGGAVLSARLGKENMVETVTGVDVMIPAKKLLVSESVYFKDVKKVLSAPNDYLVRGGDIFVLRGGDMPLRFGLHYRNFDERYAIYWRLKDGERQREREERVPIDIVQPGYGQYENDELHNMREKSSVGITADGTRRYARAGGYFEYDFAVDAECDNLLSLELLAEDNGKRLIISAGNTVLFDERLLYTQGERRYRREILLPKELIEREGRKKNVGGREQTVLSILFAGDKNRRSAAVCQFIYVYRA